MSNEVDIFGRTIPSHRRGDGVEGKASRRSRSRDRGSPRDRDRGRDRDRVRGRSRSRDRDSRDRRGSTGSGFQSTVSHYPHSNHDGRDRHSHGQEQGSRGGGDYRDSNRRHSTSDGRRGISPSTVRPRSRLAPLAPMKSFQHFMSDSDGLENLSSEESQTKYKQYQLEYTEDVSKHFFENSKYEEWFREKFNPLLKEKQIVELKQRAQLESAVLYARLLEDPQGALASMRLAEVSRDREGKSSVQAHSFSGHHLSGHLKSTLYVSNIPANCTRVLLARAITAAINDANTVAKAMNVHPPRPSSDGGETGAQEKAEVLPIVAETSVERIALAPPTWSCRGSQYSFNRVGWVTFKSGSSMSLALKALRELRIEIPSDSSLPIDSTVSPPPTMTFRLQASIHSPRSLSRLPDFMSTESRIVFDKTRAVALATLLDADRGVPEDTNLAAILRGVATKEEGGAGQGEQKNVTGNLPAADVLDVAVAYLRRVHLFLYYSGKHFLDEAQLLSSSHSILGRSLPPASVTVPDGNGDKENEGVEEKSVEVAEKETVEAKSVEVAERETVEATSDSATAISDSVISEYLGPTNPTIVALDTRVAEFIQIMETRVGQSKEGAEVELTADERDAKAISEAQNKVISEIAGQNCIDMGENSKVRCAVSECKKLFKGKEFLQKHIQNKHPELVFERLVRIAEPYMLTRYEAVDITARLLPPVEIEGREDRIEERSVREIRDIALNKTLVHRQAGSSNSINNNNRRAEKRRHSNDFSDDRGGGGWGGDNRYRMSLEGPRDHREGFIPPPPPFSAPPIPRPDPNARTLKAYRDVDAPIAVSCVDSDFGVSLPPPKKRKLIIKKK